MAIASPHIIITVSTSPLLPAAYPRGRQRPAFGEDLHVLHRRRERRRSSRPVLLAAASFDSSFHI
jgi:hypothetical protein